MTAKNRMIDDMIDGWINTLPNDMKNKPVYNFNGEHGQIIFAQSVNITIPEKYLNSLVKKEM